MRFLVAIDGAGETDGDFSVLVVNAESRDEAIGRVIDPEMGYGRDEDGVAYAVPLEDVTVYRVNDSTRRTAEPTTFEDVVAVTAPALREYLDVDGGHKEERLLQQAKELEVADAAAERSREILTTPATLNEVEVQIILERDAAKE